MALMSIDNYRVTDSGCHEYLGKARNFGGYPKVMKNGKTWTASRLVWTTNVGAIPDGLFVLHKCDNPLCINVDHLFLGTYQDNMNDMYSKGRGLKAKGTGHHMAKFIDEDVRRIREAALFGAMQIDIAPLYDTTQGTIGKIVRREQWSHVE